MKRGIWVGIALAAAFFAILGWAAWVHGAAANSAWEPPDTGPVLSEPVHVVRFSEDSHELLVGTQHSFYRSTEQGRRWRILFRSMNGNRAVHAVCALKKGDLLVAAGRRIYVSRDGGRHWKAAFSAQDEVWTLAAGPEDAKLLMAGTGSGIYASEDGGKLWKPWSLGLPAGKISSVVWSSRFHSFFSLTDAGIYRLRLPDIAWERVAVGSRSDPFSSEELDTADEPEESGFFRAAVLTVDDRSGCLYAGSSTQGVFVSRDGGETWRLLSPLIAGTPSVVDLCTDSDAGLLYVLAKDRIFRWDPFDLSCKEMPVPALFGGLCAISADSRQGCLWIGATAGLFRMPIAEDIQPRHPVGGADMQAGDGGPSIQEIHKAAIKYAEVEPEKIAGWRTKAALSAWMPHVSFGVDKDKNRTITSATSGGKTNFYIGPEDQSLGVGIDFTWDLAELLWNPDQVSIDTRSRLMVQLRQDILEDVTRLYFERKRLLAEFSGNPSADPSLSAERKLRIQEIEAHIDALTGGVFTKKIFNAKK